MYRTIIILIGLLIISCKNKTNDFDKSTNKELSEGANIVEKIEIKEENSNVSKRDFKILGNLLKDIDTKNSKTDEIEELGCNDWVISTEKVNQIFFRMKEVNSNEWNSYCYHYPCSYKGKAYYNGEEYDLYINAASYIILTSDSNSKLYFIMEDKNDLFLQACNCCED